MLVMCIYLLAITSFIGIDDEEDKDVIITGTDESDDDLLLYESVCTWYT